MQVHYNRCRSYNQHMSVDGLDELSCHPLCFESRITKRSTFFPGCFQVRSRDPSKSSLRLNLSVQFKYTDTNLDS